MVECMCAIVYTYVYIMTHIQGSVLFNVSKLRHVEQHTPSMVVCDYKYTTLNPDLIGYYRKHLTNLYY